MEPRLTFRRIRGFGATTAGLFCDVLRPSNPAFVISYGLEPYGAERIEVPRGLPSSSIDKQARRPSQLHLQTTNACAIPRGRIGDREFNCREGKFDLSGPIDADGTFSYRLTGLARESDT